MSVIGLMRRENEYVLWRTDATSPLRNCCLFWSGTFWSINLKFLSNSATWSRYPHISLCKEMNEKNRNPFTLSLSLFTLSTHSSLSLFIHSLYSLLSLFFHSLYSLLSLSLYSLSLLTPLSLFSLSLLTPLSLSFFLSLSTHSPWASIASSWLSLSPLVYMYTWIK